MAMQTRATRTRTQADKAALEAAAAAAAAAGLQGCKRPRQSARGVVRCFAWAGMGVGSGGRRWQSGRRRGMMRRVAKWEIAKWTESSMKKTERGNTRSDFRLLPPAVPLLLHLYPSCVLVTLPGQVPPPQLENRPLTQVSAPQPDNRKSLAACLAAAVAAMGPGARVARGARE